MRINRSSLFIIILGALLVLGPLAVRVLFLGYNRRAAPPAPVVQIESLPNMPPTPTAVAATTLSVDAPTVSAASGAPTVLVDLAHFTGVTVGQLQPLAVALAQRGIALDYWGGDFDAMDIEANFTLNGTDLNLPDQSEQLTEKLKDADAMIVVTSFTAWSDAELAALQAFVEDGGNLLIISDPDISGVDVSTTNRLAQPFGVIFEDGYLYDRILNDEHFTHVPMTGFQNRAQKLADSAIFLYGSRSLSGRVDSQVLSAQTTLNSQRAGITGFTTLALASPRGQGYPQNVMALGDLDVLTEPFVGRYDNKALLEFVADFLAGGLRTQTLTDFPAYLGERVILLTGETPRNALFLNQSATLQRALEASGRTLTLQGPSTIAAVLGDDAGGGAGSLALPVADYIYLSDFATAAQETTLFETGDLGIREEVARQPLALELTVGGSEEVTATTASSTPPVTAFQTITHTFVVLEDNIELVAEETIVVLRQPVGRFSTLVAVLAESSAAVEEGLTRLTTNSFANCITTPNMAVCPYTGESTGDAGSSNGSSNGAEGERPALPAGPGDFRILVVADDDQASASAAQDGDEAMSYLAFYSALGLSVSEWRTQTDGSPTGEDLADYDWVIWSSGEAEVGGPDDNELDAVTEYMFQNGGVITISGRDTGFFAQAGEALSVVDVVSTGVNATLADGLPAGPIDLTPSGATAVLVSEDFSTDFYEMILVRGPDSTAPGEPIMVAQAVDYDGDGTDDGFMLLGMSMTWLPESIQTELMANMYIWASGLE